MNVMRYLTRQKYAPIMDVILIADVMHKKVELGFLLVRVKGSHYFVQYDDGYSTVVPVYGSETIRCLPMAMSNIRQKNPYVDTRKNLTITVT
ncbi:MAG: hypothetical protein EXR80_02225 [Methylococcales bacterium]|nr:hypothetical protein [Methylococcales bacterium]